MFRHFKRGYLEYCSPECGKRYSAEKVKRTCMERYGKVSPLAVKEFIEKGKETSLRVYGTEHPSQSEIVKRHMKETCLERYGVEYASQSERYRENYTKTCMERYGGKSSLVVKEFRDRGKKVQREKRYDNFKRKTKLFRNIDLLSSKEDYINENEFLFRCGICGKKFWSSATNFQDVVCECQKLKSNGEIEILKWLKKLGFFVKIGCRSVITPLELDIYIPSHNLAIEFDGLYWHSDLYKDKNYHLDKTLQCEKKGVELIHIFENEWNTKQEIVKSIILSKLGKFENTINSEDCEIREISDEIYEEFCMLNHIQGYAPAKIKLGLFFKDELIQIASFEENKEETELIRSCSLLNTQVINGFNKLIQRFVKEYSPEKLVFYADRKYFSKFENWKLVSKTSPKCWYWKNGGDFLLSESSFDSDDLLRIWDCGMQKFQFCG